MSKPTRRDLLVVIGRLQDKIGEAIAVNNDRNLERFAETRAALEEAHELCVMARGADSPLEDAGSWSSEKRPVRRRTRV